MMRIERTAPLTRTVCQLTGDVADRPSKFFDAMAAADDQVDDVAQARQERDDARAELDDAMQSLRDLGALVAVLTSQAAMWHAERDELRDERDEWRDRYDEKIRGGTTHEA